MLSTIVLCVLAAAAAGLPGYIISFRFNRSNYAATDTSGDFGSPRGGFIATFLGMLTGMAFVSLTSHLSFVPSAAVGPAMIVAMSIGALAGIAGMIRGQKNRKAGGDKQ